MSNEFDRDRLSTALSVVTDWPVGTVSARYEGLNGLIDTLVAMGVISQDEVMGYRMMLTMFARPAEGTDVLTTELQFNEGGEIIANGQKIK